jgi:hypothetical protein
MMSCCVISTKPFWSPLTPALVVACGGSGPQAPPSVRGLTLAAQAFRMEAKPTARGAEALGATTAAIAWRKVVSALVARSQIEFVEGHWGRSRLGNVRRLAEKPV